jgi:hypothetical protein
MLCTLFQKNLISTLTQQGWGRQLYAISAALTKMRFGVGGAAVDVRLFATLMRGGLTNAPDPALGVRFPDNLRDVRLLRSALARAQTIDLPPPRPADAEGRYSDLIGFFGEDTGLGTYAYLAFEAFGGNIPSQTYLYLVIVTASLVLYGVGHWRSVGAMAAVVVVSLALYLVVCADIVNFAGIDVKDPRFLSTIAAVPLLHVIAVWTRPSCRLGPLDYFVVALQAAIFAFALQIRSPVVWAVLALSALYLIGGALALRDGRSLPSLLDWRRSRSAPMPITVFAVLLSGHLLAVVTLHPIYQATGDVPRHTFWQGVLSSLQINPEWTEKYGAAFNNASDDAMPEEAARIAVMKLPPEERQQYLNGGGVIKRTALEKFSRLVFFDILRSDPKFVLHAFFIDKPKHVWSSELQFFGGLFKGLPVWNALVPPAVFLFIVFLVMQNEDTLETLLRAVGVIPLFIVFSLLPNWLVLPNAMVMVDNFVWTGVLIVLLLVIVATLPIRYVVGAKRASEMTAF